MVPFIIYWAAIIVCIAWAALSVFFTIFYLARKENGNLWAFALFNVIAAIALAIVLAIYPHLGLGHYPILQLNLFDFGRLSRAFRLASNPWSGTKTKKCLSNLGNQSSFKIGFFVF